MTQLTKDSHHLLLRLWQYQKERFPIAKHGILILSFSFCAVCLSSLLRQQYSWPNFSSAAVAFVCVFGFFLQLRIADEFKDHETDAKYRPERAVPRGLVSLTELKYLGYLTATIQLCLSYWLQPLLLILLFTVWLYMLLMNQEFFVADWLKKHPFTYLWSHMLIMPLIDLYATACDWLLYAKFPPDYLLYFLIISFFNGIIIEVGRKTWSPEQERQGVDSYSSNWGLKKSVAIWLVSMTSSGICATITAHKIGFLIATGGCLAIFKVLLMIFACSFVYSPTPQKAKWLEVFSGLWVMCLYLILGIIPMAVSLYL